MDGFSHRFWICIKVEGRKLVDTCSARWLLFIMAFVGLSLVVLSIVLSMARGATLEVSAIVTVLALPGAVIAPLLSILSVTSDWQHREVVKYYALQPRRTLILSAKYVAVSAFAVVVIVIVCIVALIAAALLSAFSGAQIVYGSILSSVWLVVCGVLVGSISGAAVASALMSTPVAVVFVLVQSTVADVLIGLVPNFPAEYFQSATFSNFLSEGGDVLPALSSAFIWILVPAAIGVRRQTCTDVV